MILFTGSLSMHVVVCSGVLAILDRTEIIPEPGKTSITRSVLDAYALHYRQPDPVAVDPLYASILPWLDNLQHLKLKIWILSAFTFSLWPFSFRVVLVLMAMMLFIGMIFYFIMAISVQHFVTQLLLFV